MGVGVGVTTDVMSLSTTTIYSGSVGVRTLQAGRILSTTLTEDPSVQIGVVNSTVETGI